MPENYDVATLVGSLCDASYTRLVAETIAELAPQHLRFRFVEIGDLPLYDPDLDSNPPEAWRAFRDTLRPADGVLFATPEYNRSMPGVLKNALDVGSRPYGESAWEGKPAGIVSVSPSAIAAFGANHHLRQTLVFLNMPAMQQPEAYVGNAAKLFDEFGNLTNPSTREFLTKFGKAFAEWIEVHANKRSLA